MTAYHQDGINRKPGTVDLLSDLPTAFNGRINFLKAIHSIKVVLL